jgi:hypothetical protein
MNMPRFGVSAIAVIPEANSTPMILAGTGDRDANDAPGLWGLCLDGWGYQLFTIKYRYGK